MTDNTEVIIWLLITLLSIWYRENISSICSSNSEASTSELLEHIEEIFLVIDNRVDHVQTIVDRICHCILEIFYNLIYFSLSRSSITPTQSYKQEIKFNRECNNGDIMWYYPLGELQAKFQPDFSHPFRLCVRIHNAVGVSHEPINLNGKMVDTTNRQEDGTLHLLTTG